MISSIGTTNPQMVPFSGDSQQLKCKSEQRMNIRYMYHAT